MRIEADPHEVLGLSRGCSPEELRAAHRRLLRQVHPDVGGSQPLFEAVQGAYRTLSAPPAPPAPRAPRPEPVVDVPVPHVHDWPVEILVAVQILLLGLGVLFCVWPP